MTLRARILALAAFDERLRLYAVGACRTFTAEAGIPTDHAYTQMCEHAGVATAECVHARLLPLLTALADCADMLEDSQRVLIAARKVMRDMLDEMVLDAHIERNADALSRLDKIMEGK